MTFLLSWILPIVVGAAIGYVTNDIAIKMLFRPLKEKRILGMRVPFTPGILPKNRHKLALSIGNTVSSQLLNAEVLTKRFKAADFRETVAANVDSFLAGLLDTRLEALSFPAGSAAYGKVSSFLARAVQAIVDSPDFEAAAASLIGSALDRIGAIKAGTFMGDKDSIELARSIVDSFLSERGTERVAARFRGGLDSWLAGDKPLSALFPGDLSEAASRLVTALYPEALRVFLDFVRTPSMRAGLAEHGKGVVASLLKRLNVFQRFVVTAAKYDQAIMENMDETVADLITQLELLAAKTLTRDTLAERAAKAAAEWSELPPEKILKRLPDAREKILGAAERLLSALGDEKGRERLAQALAGFLDSLRERSLMQIAERDIGLSRDRLAALVKDAAVGALQKPGGPEGIAGAAASFVSSFVESRKGSSIAELFRVTPEFRAEISAGIAAKALDLIEGRVGDIVATIRIHDTVVEKIDSLDILSVERIVLDIMKEQFVWINVFGAVLGGIIGLAQAVMGAIF
jgi:hypothetical protein